ncbi:uncharacterized protein H6S33_012764 [Morchella sextelata]|uniref:uncharacterized protein n=1 Tax=Morchella sextelata TaxID=1174677 RepID=UPI001D03618D|nr:uncharacterized protein H6S33_012764 [Morchella sextelata]KAH0609278.1 hypothetical protein H6S33_012764 [Morchella sextelata]
MTYHVGSLFVKAIGVSLIGRICCLGERLKHCKRFPFSIELKGIKARDTSCTTTELLGRGINATLGVPRTVIWMFFGISSVIDHVTARTPRWVNSVDMKRCTHACLNIAP